MLTATNRCPQLNGHSNPLPVDHHANLNQHAVLHFHNLKHHRHTPDYVNIHIHHLILPHHLINNQRHPVNRSLRPGPPNLLPLGQLSDRLLRLRRQRWGRLLPDRARLPDDLVPARALLHHRHQRRPDGGGARERRAHVFHDGRLRDRLVPVREGRRCQARLLPERLRLRHGELQPCHVRRDGHCRQRAAGDGGRRWEGRGGGSEGCWGADWGCGCGGFGVDRMAFSSILLEDF